MANHSGFNTMAANFLADKSGNIVSFTKLNEPVEGHSDYEFRKGSSSFVCTIHFRLVNHVAQNFDYYSQINIEQSAV